jgi:hypothetical protein
MAKSIGSAAKSARLTRVGSIVQALQAKELTAEEIVARLSPLSS